MNQTQRLRPGQPNPLRYQGNLRHYHVAPLKRRVHRGQLAGNVRSKRRKAFWPGAAAAARVLVVFGVILGGVWIGIGG
jgi:hypothetical protein